MFTHGEAVDIWRKRRTHKPLNSNCGQRYVVVLVAAMTRLFDEK